MPRPKKAPGLAADPRNGQQVELREASSLPRFGLPRRAAGWELRTRQAWKALWDDPVSRALSLVDRELVVRWAESLDDWVSALAKGRLEPVVVGSVGQPVKSPHFDIAKDAMRVVLACEAQIGVGALNRARLGIAILNERMTLDQINARYLGGGDADEQDPRL
jgi:hypothetical protein